MIDLSKVGFDTGRRDYRITKFVRSEDYGIDLKKYYHNGKLEKLKFPKL